MAYWDVPNKEESNIIRALSENPDHTMVHRVGQDCFVVLNMRTRGEYYINQSIVGTNVLRGWHINIQNYEKGVDTMYLVRHKKTGEIFRVYAVQGTNFLFYIRDEPPHWEYAPIGMFEPVGETK